MRRFGYLLIVTGLCLALAQVAVYGSRLPERVASHFGVNGEADGWMSRPSFLALFVALQFGMTALFLLLGWGLPRIPNSMINIPNREYWLDESRRAVTLRIIQAMLILITGITSLFLVILFQMTIRVNLEPGGRLGSAAWWLLGAYLIMTGGICGWLVWRFGRVPAV